MSNLGVSNLTNDQRLDASAAPTAARPAPPDAGAAKPATVDKFPGPLDATSKTPRNRETSQPTPSTYSLRIEYAPDAAGDLPTSDQDLLPNWSREFTVSGKTTLEQLSEIILDILDWDSLHLYEFRIDNRVYAHMVFLSEDDLFGFASSGERRRYWDGLGSSDMEKRNKAVQSAVRWLIEM
jgi:hypothetical protein